MLEDNEHVQSVSYLSVCITMFPPIGSFLKGYCENEVDHIDLMYLLSEA